MSKGRDAYKSRTDVDQGWAWVVLVASSVGLSLTTLCYTGGIFNIIFLEEFKMSKQKTAWLTALPGCLISLTGPLASAMIARIGHRKACMLGGLIGASGYFLTFFVRDFVTLLLCFGLVVGLGMGICYVTCIVVLSVYFDKYRNLSTGIAMGICAMGTVALPIIIVKSVEEYGWRGTMLILSGLFLQLIACGAAFRPLQRSKNTFETIEIDVDCKYSTDGVELNGSAMCSDHEHEDPTVESQRLSEAPPLLTENHLVDSKDDGLPRAQSVKTRPRHTGWVSFVTKPDYILLCLTVSFNNAGTFITFVHYPAYFVQQGSTESDVALFLMSFGIANVVCRLMGGVATSNKEFNVLLLYMFSCGFVGVLLLLCPLLSGSYAGQLTFSVLFGLYGNWVYSLHPTVTVHVLGGENLTAGFGIGCFFGGVGALIGPPLAGWIFDITNSYVYSFVAAGAFYSCSTMMTMMIPILSRKNSTPEAIL